MKNLSILFLSTVFTCTLFSCSSSSEDDMTPTDDDPIVTVTYNDHIKTIIDNNCIGCHVDPSPVDAPMALTTYEEVKDAMETRPLIERIKGEITPQMPLNQPPLTNNQIGLIEQWEADGLLEE